MNKMVVNHLEKLFVTSDAATIIRETDIHHPAAKMIAMAAKMQENEAGDGTNFVISLAGELMTQAMGLLKMGLHPSEILIGYEKGANFAIDLIEKMECYKATNLRDHDEISKCIRTSIAAKQFGQEDFLSKLIGKAALQCLPTHIKSFTVDSVRVQKILGGGIFDSEVIAGMVILRGSETSITQVKDAKIAVFNATIEMQQGETKGTVLLKNSEELLNYTK